MSLYSCSVSAPCRPFFKEFLLFVVTLFLKTRLQQEQGTQHPAGSLAESLEVEECFTQSEVSAQISSEFTHFSLTKNAKAFLSWDSNGASHWHKAEKFLGTPCKNQSLPAQRCGRRDKGFYPNLMNPTTFFPTLQTISSGQIPLPAAFRPCFSLLHPGSFTSPLPCLH